MKPIHSLEYLSGLDSTRIRLGLDRVSRLLKRLNHPQKRYATLIIGGTNGKGSIAAMTSSILSAGGFRAGLYTSPHLIDVRERIRVDGLMIPTGDLQSCIETVRQHLIDPVTYFELLTVSAFLYFDQRQVDVAVLEVGMGGRLDATNAADPVLSVISNIAMDHTAHLGSRLGDIAGEKAGIIKRGVPCVTAVRQGRLRELLEAACRAKKSRLYRLGRDIRVRKGADGGFSVQAVHRRYERLSCPLKGRHQLDNAALAVGVADLLNGQGFRLGPEAVERGLKGTRWEGRLEVLQERPTVIVDAAHNPAGIAALCDALETQFSYDRLIVVFGVLDDKDYTGMLARLSPLAKGMIITRPDSSRASSPEAVFAVAKQRCRDASLVEKPATALRSALADAGPDDLICVTGSVCLIGEIKRIYQETDP